MRCRWLKTLGVFATLALASSYAQTTQMRVTIPFDFTVGKAVLPAGVYEIRNQAAIQNQVLFSGAGGSGALIATGHPLERSSATEQGTVVFSRYGDTYFLQSVWLANGALGLGMVKSKAETELAKTASTRRPEQVIRIASR